MHFLNKAILINVTIKYIFQFCMCFTLPHVVSVM